ncbi:MAG: YncE family protein [Crocinitomicaceae bacterium]|nr:YncE family protein [Crocinitomicaceae bacterium]
MRLISLLLVLLLFSCKKDDLEEVVVSSSLSDGVVVLCEGLFQQNNSTLSWINNSDGSVSNTLFSTKVGRQLGDTGNDIKRYGGKIYIVVNVSSTIEVLDAINFTSVAQISMMENGVAKQPRNIEFYGDKAYVTCFDGFVDVFDTTSFNISQRIAVGLNPEDLTVSGSKLFVTNSGGLNSPLMDSTVSIIDLNTNAEIDRITVGKNPGGCLTDNEGDVYVITRGDYGAIPSRLVRINSLSNMVAENFSFDASGLTKMNDKIIISYYDFSTSMSRVDLFDPISETIVEPNFIDLSGINTLYGVHYNPFRNSIYLSDAMSFTNTGYVHEYSTSGNLLSTYHVGLNPSKFIFYE